VTYPEKMELDESESTWREIVGRAGVNVAGAIRLARELGPGKTIVTILCDTGNRYQSKLFNPAFMRSKNLPVPAWLEQRSEIKPPFV